VRNRPCREAAGQLALIWLIMLAPAMADESVTWLTIDLPPLFIADGALAGRGSADQQLAFLTQSLPQFQHRQTPASFSRVWHQIGHGDGNCTIGALRTPERGAIAMFSQRPVPVPGYHVIIRADQRDDFAPYLDSRGRLDLDLLAARSSLRGGYVTSRRHAPRIDRFIAASHRQTPLDPVMSPLQLFHLLSLRRQDFIFALPFEIGYYRDVDPRTPPLLALPIKDVAAMVNGHVACSNGPIGRKVVSAVDLLLRNPNNWRSFVAPLQQWLSPEDYDHLLSGSPMADDAP
jgi:uncharacterized protein (TIGR02285 family)